MSHAKGNLEDVPPYWTSGNEAEVDFIVQSGNDIIPIEVKRTLKAEV
ncbi:MAG: DUF4143 domain-containing protein [Bacteroidota bacterium]